MRSLILFLLTALAATAQTADPVGLRALTSLEWLPQLRTHTTAQHVSSHDPTGGNDDGFFSVNFLYYDRARKEYVLLEEQGPGCIYRIQMADLRPLGGAPVRLRIYLEGAASPQVDEELSRFFSGSVPPFIAPLVGATHQAKGFGYYCFVPIPYRQGVRVALTGLVHFYNISYHRYRPGIGPVPRFGQDGNLQDAARLLLNAGRRPTPVRSGEQTLATTLHLAPQAEGTVASLQGPGTVLALTVDLNGNRSTLNLDDLWLKCFWDGHTDADVEAPFSLFFATGSAGQAVPGLFVGAQGKRLYCYFPMPFFTGAQVLVENRGRTPAVLPVKLTFRAGLLPGQGRGRTAYFRTRYRADPATTPGADYVALDLGGRGHLVGVVLEMGAPDLLLFDSYLEGDDRLYVDYRRTPAHHGNGTEDFFGGAYYFLGETPALPLHGSPLYRPALVGSRRLAYRFFWGDLVPFAAHCRLGFEVGGYGHLRGSYRSLVFLYHDPAPALRLTDHLDVGDATSEAAHHYQGGAVRVGPLRAAFEGDLDDLYLQDTGRALPPGKSVSFRVRIQPQNDGVILRRRFDYLNGGGGGQAARVVVNGRPAGVWRTPGRYLGHLTAFPNLPPYRGQGLPDKLWREEDFELPATLTAGRSFLDIQMQNVGTVTWNAYAYRVYTRLAVPQADTLPPPAPGALSVQARPDDAVELTWPAVRDDVGTAYYEVWRWVPPRLPVLVGRPFGPRFVDRHPPAPQAVYLVRAVDGSGNLSPPSPPALGRTGPAVRYEAEELPVLAQSPNALVGRLDHALFPTLGRFWSGDAQLLFAGRQLGDGLQLALRVPAAGRYALNLTLTPFPGSGPVEVRVDGALWGSTPAAPPGFTRLTHRFPPRLLTAGSHTLTLSAGEPQTPFAAPAFLVDTVRLEPR